MTDPTRPVLRNIATPVYQQIADYLRADVLAGRYLPGAPLPSESQITQAYGVSDLTARRAVRVLAEAGLARVVRGKGAYVADPSRPAAS